MRRRIILIFPLAFAFLGLIYLFSTKVFADTSTVSVEVSAYFDDENHNSTTVTGQKIGSKVSFSSNLETYSGYSFSMWIYNGIVQEGLPADQTFIVTSDMSLIAIFKPDGKTPWCSWIPTDN